MQIICGQCGRQYTFDEHPPDEVLRCAKCGHYILLNPQPDQSESYENSGFDSPGAEMGFAQLAQQILSRRMIVYCSKCGEQIKLTKRLAGRMIRCRFCTQLLRVPFLDDDDMTGADKPREQQDSYVAAHERLHAAGVEKAKARQAERTPVTSRLGFWFILITLIAIGLAAVIRYRPQIRSYVKSLIEPSSSQPGPQVKVAEISLSEIPTIVTKAVAWTFFAHDGYIPARPGYLYCNLTVEIQAGKEPLTFSDTGPAVILKNAKKIFPSLGESLLGQDYSVPIQAMSRVIKLQPYARKTIVFIFELPVSLRDVSLEIASLAPQTVILPAPSGPLLPLAGEYVELQPRNCRPLLRDPIMAAIQASAPQSLDISHRDGVMIVVMSGVNITGRGRLLDEDLYEVTLTKDRDSLVCKLRQIDDNRIVLYLSDEPMHQLTFYRTKPLSSSILSRE